VKEIKQAFSTIKVDDKLKEKTYLAIKDHINKRKPWLQPVVIVNTVLVLTLILIFNFNRSNIPNNDSSGDMGINIFGEATTNNISSFTYNGNFYVISDIVINPADLDKKLGILKDLITDIDDSSQECELYTIKKDDKILVVKDGNKLYPYQKQ